MKLWIKILGLMMSASVLVADDWAGWLGPTADAVYHEEGVVTTIPENGFKVLWETPVAMGYSGPSVADGKVFLMDYVLADGEITNRASWSDELKGEERVLCFDQQTGRQLWAYSYDRSYNMSYPGGPRCSVIYSDGKVYALGAEGDLNCLNADTGEVIWSKRFYEDYGAETPRWGHAAHPLVYQDLLICMVGGIGSVVVAFDKDTGEQKWRRLSSDSVGYCPPSIIHRAGVDQLIVWHPEGMNSLHPLDGSVYWYQDLRPKLGLTVNVPRVSGSLMFASGQGGPAALIRLDDQKPASEIVWLGNPRNAIYTLNNTPFFTDEAIYGVYLETSALTAVDPTTGDRLWETQVPVIDAAVRAENRKRVRHGTAFIIRLQDSDTFYLMSENGDFIIAELTPEAYREIGRENLLEPTNFAMGRSVVWSHPAFADKTLFARNDKKLIAVDLSEDSYL